MNKQACCVTAKNVIARRPQADVAIAKGDRHLPKKMLHGIATPLCGRGSQ